MRLSARRKRLGARRWDVAAAARASKSPRSAWHFGGSRRPLKVSSETCQPSSGFSRVGDRLWSPVSRWRLDDLPGPEAACADEDSLHAAVDQCPHPLQIRLPSASIDIVSMTHGATGDSFLLADGTVLGHGMFLLGGREPRMVADRNVDSKVGAQRARRARSVAQTPSMKTYLDTPSLSCYVANCFKRFAVNHRGY